MLLTTICRSAITPIRTFAVMNGSSVAKNANSNMTGYLRLQMNPIRSFKSTARLAEKPESHFVRRAKERMGIKDRAMAPTQGTAFGIGQGALMGASALGLGMLCYYGLGVSSKPGTLEYSAVWPQYVKDRIHATYMYFGGSVALTAMAAAAAFRSPAMMNLMMRNSWLAIGASMAAMIGTGMVVRGIPYSPGFGVKQLGWIAHSAVIGAVLAPMCFMGGPILARAAMMTAGVIGGLSTIAVCAPSEQFLNMGGPLAIGLGVVFASSLGTMFFPATTALGSGLFSISLYGGLILFSGFMLYDTQRIIKYAETLPPNTAQPYDPINASMSIYLDTINIFIRIAQILAMGGSGRRK